LFCLCSQPILPSDIGFQPLAYSSVSPPRESRDRWPSPPYRPEYDGVLLEHVGHVVGLPAGQMSGPLPGQLTRGIQRSTSLDPLDPTAIAGERLDHSVYRYNPPLEQVRAWLAQPGLAVEEEGIGDGYAHFLARRSV
jgi:hypothetical protein